jgi:hypothetical protein
MVSAPLFIVLAVAAFVAVKWGPAKASHLALGVLLGLSLATTAAGPPILNGITTAMDAIVSTVSNAAGGGRR